MAATETARHLLFCEYYVMLETERNRNIHAPSSINGGRQIIQYVSVVMPTEHCIHIRPVLAMKKVVTTEC